MGYRSRSRYRRSSSRYRRSSSRYRRSSSRYRRRSRYRRSTFFRSTTDNQLKAIDFAWNKASENNPFDVILDTPAGTSNMLVLNNIQQGTSFYNRIGRKVTVRSVNISGNLELYFQGDEAKDSEPNPEAINVRMLLVYDRHPNGSLPAFNDMFASFDNTGAKKTSSYASPLDITKTGRFRILRDKFFNLKPGFYKAEYGAGEHAVYASRQIKQYIKVPNLETVYQDTSNPPTIGDISSGALYLIFRASTHNNAVQDFFTSLSTVNIRVRYDDL